MNAPPMRLDIGFAILKAALIKYDMAQDTVCTFEVVLLYEITCPIHIPVPFTLDLSQYSQDSGSGKLASPT